jgi:hypothetical protein
MYQNNNIEHIRENIINLKNIRAIIRLSHIGHDECIAELSTINDIIEQEQRKIHEIMRKP